MRRERTIALLAMLIAVAGVTLFAPGRASAASPREICNDLIAHGGTTSTNYAQADIDAYRQALQNDPTIQGYCPPLVVVTTQSCVEVAPGTPNAVQAQNGKWFLYAPNGNAEACTTPPGTTTTTTTTAATPPTPTAGVLGTTKVKQAPAAPTAAVSPSTRSAAPLATTRSSGTLPFTGLQLGVFAAVGIALLLGGLLLRTTSRKHPDAS